MSQTKKKKKGKGRAVGIGIAAVAGLILCSLIGQFVVGGKGSITSSRSSDSDYYYEYSVRSDEITYVGQQDSEEVTGGQTVGLLSDDMYGDCYLLTPGTSMQAGIVLDDEERTLRFSYLIHEDTAQLSDGSVMNLVILAEDGETVLYEDTLNVTSESQAYELELSSWSGQTIGILFSVPPQDDESGDWVILQDALID